MFRAHNRKEDHETFYSGSFDRNSARDGERTKRQRLTVVSAAHAVSAELQ